jgi:hypothetical protein
MKNLKYFELIAYFYSSIFSQMKQGIDFDMALNSRLDDYWFYPEFENRLSNLIVEIQYLNVKYATHKKFTEKQIEGYRHQLELIKNDDLNIWLSPDELEHFNETVYNLNAEIDDFLQRTEPVK